VSLRLTGPVDPRLRAAVDTSVAWYDGVFALHGIATRSEGGLWWSAAPLPWHSSVKTTEPGVGVDRVLAVHERGAVADSFGDLDLRPHGFGVLIDASWVHHPPLDAPPSRLPDGWTVVRDAFVLAEWNRAHDYEGVLLPPVLDRPAFTVLAHHSHGVLDGGAALHRPARGGDLVVGLSNAWTAGTHGIDHTELLGVVGAVHPGAAVTDYASGTDLEAMVVAGYAPLGPQRVWVREDP
jgi:hypothetical protein